MPKRTRNPEVIDLTVPDKRTRQEITPLQRKLNNEFSEDIDGWEIMNHMWPKDHDEQLKMYCKEADGDREKWNDITSDFFYDYIYSHQFEPVVCNYYHDSKYENTPFSDLFWKEFGNGKEIVVNEYKTVFEYYCDICNIKIKS